MDQEPRTETSGITLRIKFKSESLDKFLDRYAVDVSPGGIFVRTKKPLAAGTAINFHFTLFDGSPLLSGHGTVVWVRETDPARPEVHPGMGLRFDKLTGQSQSVLAKILSEKSRREREIAAGTRTNEPRRFTAVAMDAVRDDQPGATPASPGSGLLAVDPARQRRAVSGAVESGPIPGTPVGRDSGAHPMLGADANPAAITQDGATPPADENWDNEKTEIASLPPSHYFDEMAASGTEDLSSQDMLPASVDLPPARAAAPGPLQRSAAAAPAAVHRAPTPAVGAPHGRSGAPQVSAPRSSLSMPTRGAPTPAFGVPGGPNRTPTPMAGRSPVRTTTPISVPRVPTPLGTPARPAVAATGGVPRIPTPPPIPVGAGYARLPTPLPLATGKPPASRPELPAFPDFASSAPAASARKPASNKAGAGRMVAVGVLAVAAGAAAAVVFFPEQIGLKSDPAPMNAPAMPASAPPAPSPPAPAAPAAETAGLPAVAVPVAPPPTEPAAAAPASPPPAAPPAAAKPAVVARPAGGPAGGGGKKPGRRIGAPVTGGDPAAVATAPAAPAAAEPAAPEPAGAAAEEIYWLNVRSTPPGAEVVLDGEVVGNTPFQRRIFDTSKPYALAIRRAGFETHERLLSASDEWVKKGSVRTLTVNAKLAKAKGGAAAAPEVKPAEQPSEAASAAPGQQ